MWSARENAGTDANSTALAVTASCCDRSRYAAAGQEPLARAPAAWKRGELKLMLPVTWLPRKLPGYPDPGMTGSP